MGVATINDERGTEWKTTADLPRKINAHKQNTQRPQRNVLKVLHKGAPRPSEDLARANCQVSSNLIYRSSKTASSTAERERSILSDMTALAILGFVIGGLCLDCVEWSGQSSFTSFKILWWKLSFYTIQSNSLVAMFYLAALTLYRKPSAIKTLMKACALMMISITMMVWHFILARTIKMDDYVDWKPRWASHILHTIVPLLCWFDWLILDRRLSSSSSTKLRLKHVPLFLICPLSYLCFSFIRASVGAPYGINQTTGEPFWHWYPFIELSNPLPIYPAAASLNVSDRTTVVFLNCVTIATAVELTGVIFVVAHNRLRR